MKLTDFFQGHAFKYLSATDSDPKVSNGHEIGSNSFKKILGTTRCEYETIFARVEDEDILITKSTSTWYDSREKNPNRSAEYRLYYKDNVVTKSMIQGNFFLIARTKHNKLLCVVCPPRSTTENKIRWLFDLPDSNIFTVQESEKDKDIGYFEKNILEELGIRILEKDDLLLKTLIELYPDSLPSTREFSQTARRLSGSQKNPISNPDDVLIDWLEMEERIFLIYEEYQVNKTLKLGFKDVNSFISEAISIVNRRKARMGLSLENHLEHIFKQNKLRFSRGKFTEGKSKPDFIFPDIKSYHDSSFPSASLTMLGVKSTCKDRWRQVLAEANRVKNKHLFTLEAGVSVDQTSEMSRNKLSLVIPQTLFMTYKKDQQKHLLSLSEFISIANRKQKI